MENLILVEGETEVEFYRRLTEMHKKGVRKSLKNLKGNWNINDKILTHAEVFEKNNGGKNFRIHLCVDQERADAVPFNRNIVMSELAKLNGFSELVPVIADRMMESLFFADIEGIYCHLGTKRSKRNVRKFSNFRKFTHVDLARIYKENGKIYQKGIRAAGLVDALDLGKIIAATEEVSSFLTKLK